MYTYYTSYTTHFFQRKCNTQQTLLRISFEFHGIIKNNLACLSQNVILRRFVGCSNWSNLIIFVFINRVIKKKKKIAYSLPEIYFYFTILFPNYFYTL